MIPSVKQQRPVLGNALCRVFERMLLVKCAYPSPQPAYVSMRLRTRVFVGTKERKAENVSFKKKENKEEERVGDFHNHTFASIKYRRAAFGRHCLSRV